MDDKMNIQAFSFIEKLTIQELRKIQNAEVKFSEMKGFKEIINLGEVSNFGIEEFDEDTNP